MMDGLVKGVRWLLMVTRTASGICLLASVAINFVNIIGRYFFSVSIPWAEEIMLFLMVGCVFTGCCAVAWEGRQIRMDVVVTMLPDKVRDFFALLSELVMIATAAAVTAFAWPVIVQLADFDERSQAANFPLVIPQAMIPIGYSLMALLVAVRLMRRPSRAAGAPTLRSIRRVATMGYFVYFGLPVILLIIGFPIFLILLVTSIVAVLTVADVPTEAIQTYMFGSLDNFPLLAVPFFVLAGEIMAQGGIARRVIAMVMAIVGGMRGSLAVTTVAASELFGAMSHTAVGTVVAMGRMIYPALKEGGYNDRFAVGLIASSGAIAVVIPPSIAMILYAISAEQSAVLLFTAGILPSLLIGLIDAAYVMGYARWKGVPLGDRAHWATIWKTSKDASWAVGSLAVIFGGIYGGVFTPTEAAGVAVVYSLPVTIFVYREVDVAGLWRILMASAYLISQILLIVTSAGIYSWLLTTSGIPQQIVASISALDMPRWELLLILNIGLLLAGSFLEPPAAILILTPLLLPIVKGVGVNPIHFGIIVAVNLSLGMYTPPFGLNLFSSQAIFNAPLSRIYLGVLPFLVVNFIALMIITYIPEISLVLVKH